MIRTEDFKSQMAEQIAMVPVAALAVVWGSLSSRARDSWGETIRSAAETEGAITMAERFSVGLLFRGGEKRTLLNDIAVSMGKHRHRETVRGSIRWQGASSR